MKKELLPFVVIPASVMALLIALYFSGFYTLQQIVAPTIAGLSSNSWREFGVLELLQNFCLLSVICILLLAAYNKKGTVDGLLFLLGGLVFIFMFLEEIDYGIHFYEFFVGADSGVTVRNWHNQETDGEQNVKRFKQLVDGVMFLVFIVLPLIKNKIPIAFIRNVAPSRWFIAGFATILLGAQMAHLLDDQGMGVIQGTDGNLSGNISEFRELGTYYFCLLYAVQLRKLDSLL
jgi:hypothetical protein